MLKADFLIMQLILFLLIADDDVGENDSDKENIVPENIANVPVGYTVKSQRLFILLLL